MDYDILAFTETHLDGNVCNDDILIENYDKPYRKDRTCHGGGLLIYINSNLAHERIDVLEIFWDESIWIKLKQNSQFYLFGIFYSPKTSDKSFFERLNQNLETALDITKDVVIMGDLNEDMLNPNNHNLKNVLLMNSLNNIIAEPTRGRALLDPILTYFDQTVLDSGILQVSSEISDHCATFITLSFEYNIHYTFKRKIWLYKQDNYAELKLKIDNFDWSPLQTLPLNDAVLFFNHSFLSLVSECIPSKEVTVRNDDKSWYDTEIRKHSRKRDRLKSIALKSKRTTDWRNYKKVRNKVNNLKRHAKERFYDNLELNLTESFTNNKRDFWRLTRYFVKKNTASCSIPPLCTTDKFNITKWHTTDKEKADCLNDYFTSVSRVSEENTRLPNFQKITSSNLDSIFITVNEVKEILDLLNVNKASGPDLINHKMLKHVSDAVLL